MEPTPENIRAWNDLHRRWAQTRAAPARLPQEALSLLPDLNGKHILHLACGTGEVSAQLLELGALVTGIDLSEDALADARERAPDAVFLVGDLHRLPTHLRRRRFEVVYGGLGVLAADDALDAWAHAAAGALRPGGELVLHDTHPVGECVDPATLRWRADYFELPLQLGDVVTALAQAGLRIGRLAELRPPSAPRRQDPRVPSEFVLVAARPLPTASS